MARLTPARLSRFRPRAFDMLWRYRREDLLPDIAAGLTVGIVALPLAMAFAIASGVKPEAGIFTAIIAGFLISALGGSRAQIGGPAGAFVVVVYGIIERYGLANLLISTILAGFVLFAMGFFRLGTLVRFMPVAVVIGFTNGIAVLIGLSQVKPFFGLQTEKLPADFFSQVAALLHARGTADPVTCILGLACLLVLFIWPKAAVRPQVKRHVIAQRLATIPAPMVVLVAATLAVGLLDLKVETIGTRFGGIPESMPAPQWPEFSWLTVKRLFAPTITIALLSAIESLLCARVADSVTGERHDPNQELMGQGIANVVAPFFGCIPSTGTVARTVANIRAGARTPLAGMIHAATLLAVVLFAAPLARDIPLTALGAILIFVAYNMGEWHALRRLGHYTVQYRTIVLATFILTVVFDLTVAVEAGVILACIFFIYRVSSLTRVERVATHPDSPLPDDVELYEVFGSMFFGAVSKLEPLGERQEAWPRAIVLDLSRMINLDTTGLATLEALHRDCRRNGTRLVVCALNAQPASLFARSGFAERLGQDDILPDRAAALRALDPARAAAP